MSADILVSLKAAKRKGLYGRKAEHLLFLAEKGHHVPPGIIYGEVAPPLAKDAIKELQGTAASGGGHRGKVRIVLGQADFGKLQEGEVLIIPDPDVGWTPLFSRAGAVIAEAGGMLSPHSAIIARECGVPIVAFMPGATSLEEGVEVHVDGCPGKESVLAVKGAE